MTSQLAYCELLAASCERNSRLFSNVQRFAFLAMLCTLL
jgi:hypothetical protein